MRDRDDSAPLATVLETRDPALLAVAKSILQDARIEYLSNGEGLPILFRLDQIVALQVAAEDAEEAKMLLRDLAEANTER
jgi:hypothetical protein